MEEMIHEYRKENSCDSEGLVQNELTESNKVTAKFAWLVDCGYQAIKVGKTVWYLNLANSVIGEYSFKPDINLCSGSRKKIITSLHSFISLFVKV